MTEQEISIIQLSPIKKRNSVINRSCYALQFNEWNQCDMNRNLNVFHKISTYPHEPSTISLGSGLDFDLLPYNGLALSSSSSSSSLEQEELKL